MSNTKQRILSAIVLVLILIAFASIGSKGVLTLIFIIGVLFVDEFATKFLQLERKSFSYIISQISFCLGYVYFNFIDQSRGYFLAINNLALIMHIVLLGYLFIEKLESKKFLTSLKSLSVLSGVFILIPMLSMSQVLFHKQWISLLLLLMIFNISVDTGAWFVGKNFGNTKLWPKISPKKTLKGFIGGSVIATLMATLISFYAFGKISLGIILGFLILSFLAQFGDLIESKLKRQVGIKDSSQLIPGHGGIYDRLDSLLFVCPFYVLFLHLYF
ncbi:MAG: hypothetical protein CME62_08030 [Halobacteriovoraceae bacterium]|nr:hypothetical protein [Halobacteriovoraceae bacterium]|tara:strand:+ start:1844 stop:2662 length:819 start_codon:yes stop_codon:yes gene_type:complete